MKPRRLQSETSVSIVSGMAVRIAQSSRAARRRGLGDARERVTHLREVSCRPRDLTSQPRDHPFNERAHLVLQRPRQRQAKQLFPSKLAEPLQGPDSGGRQVHGVRLSSATSADEATRGHVQGRPRKWERSATRDTTIDSRTVAEEIHGSHRETGRNPYGTRRCLERPQGPHEEPKERGVGVTIRAESHDAFEHPGSAAEPIQVFAKLGKRMSDVEMIHADELASARIEEDQLAQREGFERASEARARAARRLGHAAYLAEVEGVELDEPIALAQRSARDDQRSRLVQSHVHVSPLRREQEPELLQRLLVSTPVASHLGPQLQIDLDPEEALEILPRHGADT